MLPAYVYHKKNQLLSILRFLSDMFSHTLTDWINAGVCENVLFRIELFMNNGSGCH